MGSVSISEPTTSELFAIKGLSRRNVSSNDVYVISFILCDNGMYEDNERISEDALYKISELLLGSGGTIHFSSDAPLESEVARIFDCCVELDANKLSKSGEKKLFVRAKAFLYKSPGAKRLAELICNEVKAECSIGFSVNKKTCSICGSQLDSCSHKQGNIYNGKRCVAILEDPVDAYEWMLTVSPKTKAERPKRKKVVPRKRGSDVFVNGRHVRRCYCRSDIHDTIDSILFDQSNGKASITIQCS